MFNIKYGVTLVRKFPGGCDYFNFGTTQDEHSVMEKMNTQLEELQRFSKIFYDKTQRILTTNQKHALSLETFKCNSTTPVIENKRLYLGPTYDYAHLTAKELTCLQNLIVGKTIPELAAELQTSARTIEKHIQNIKEKLHCKTQCELGYLAATLGIKIDT
jgi:DNA-binding CsgD family transcriptional regulator